MKHPVGFWPLLVVGLMVTAACAQIPYPNPINHVVIIDQENRTVDNLFGSNSPNNQYYLPGLVFSTTGQAYTIAKKIKTVFSVQAFPVPLGSNAPDSVPAYAYDPGHGHGSWVSACDAPVKTDPSNTCAMDGFNHVEVDCNPGTKTQGCPPPYPTYAYVQYSDVVPYFQIASQYGYANYFFQTNQGESAPAHQFIFAGTSQPGNGPEPTWFVANDDSNNTGPGGCLASPSTTAPLVNPATLDLKTKTFPCYDHDTMADVFAASSTPITWTYYTPGQGSIWSAPDAIQSICIVSGGICTGPYWTQGASNGFVNIHPPDVLNDIAACHLSQVSWVIPAGSESDHPGENNGSGPSWVASIVNAIGNSACTDVVTGQTLTYWQDTVILITWDDWGGWYDHVVPPPLPANAPAIVSSSAYGFRVPLLVVSAYTPPGTVSNVMGEDFGTLLKFTEEIFNLGNIQPGGLGAFADSWSNGDLSEFFQFGQPPNTFQSIQAPLSAKVFLDPKHPIEPPDND